MDELTFSVSQIARSMGAARDTVSRKLAAAGVEPAGERNGFPVYGLAAIVAAFTTHGAKTQDPDQMPAFERRAWVASERDRLKLEIDRGNSITRERFEDAYHGLVKVLVRGLVTLGDRLERDKRVSSDVLEYLENAIGDLRDELAAAVLASGVSDESAVGHCGRSALVSDEGTEGPTN